MSTYKILYNKSPDELASTVSGYLERGYELHGELFEYLTCGLIQVVVKRQDQD